MRPHQFRAITLLLALVFLLSMGTWAQQNQPSVIATGTVTTQNTVDPSGTPPANSVVVSQPIAGYLGASFIITGTWTGSLTLEYTNTNNLNGTWFAANYVTSSTGTGSTTAAITANNATPYFAIVPAGITYLRLSATAAMTGTATVTITNTLVGTSVYPGGGGGGVPYSPSGTQTVITAAGSTVTTTPAAGATQPVSGTVTASPAGTATVQPIQNGNASFTTTSTITVTNSATVIVGSNASRKGIIIVNNGATVCYLGNASVISGAAAGANGGAYLGASGGSFMMAYSGCYTGPISAITASGSTVVAVLEWRMFPYPIIFVLYAFIRRKSLREVCPGYIGKAA